ncbi:MAG: GPGG-motif small membrane protein [Sporichthyaceae bacterium]
MSFLLWVLAVILVVAGVVNMLQGQIILGLILLIVGLAIGPGGYSIFKSRGRARA